MRDAVVIVVAACVLALVGFLVFGDRGSSAVTPAPVSAPARTAPATTLLREDVADSVGSERVSTPGSAGVASRTATTSSSSQRARIFGRVVDDGGLALADVRLVAFARAGRWIEGATFVRVEHEGREVEGFETRTGADGAFELDVPVPSATWVAIAFEPSIHHARSTRNFGRADFHQQPRLHAGDNDLGDVVLAVTGAIAGEVRSANGRALAGAAITLVETKFAPTVATTSGADGRFTLGHVAAGTRGIAARLDGFLTRVQHGIDVQPRRTTNDVVLVLERAPTISGRVTDESGVPLAAITVTGRPQGAGSMARAESDAAGAFEMVLPQSQAHVLGVDMPAFEPWGGGKLDAPVQPGTRDVAIVLKRRAATTFVVLDGASGAPIERYGLRLGYRPGVAEFQPLKGDIEVEDHPRGECSASTVPDKQLVHVQAHGYAPFVDEVRFDTPPAPRQTLRLTRGGALVGRVLLPTGPAAGAAVQSQRGARADDGGAGKPKFDLNDFAGRPRWWTCGADGAFRVVDLAAGTYELRVEGGGGAPKWVRDLRLEAGATLDVGDVVLAPEAVVTGRVVVGPNASPIGLRVWLDEGRAREQWIETMAGTFRFEALAAGDHTLTVASAPPALMEDVARSFQVAEGERASVVIDLTAQAPCRLTVLVTRAGLPVEGVDVDARVASTSPKTSWLGMRLGRTSANGTVRAVLQGGRAAEIEARGSNGAPLGTYRTDFLPPGGAQEIAIEVATGSLVVNLPEAFEIPRQGMLEVRLAPRDAPKGGEITLRVETSDSPTRKPEGWTWSSRRVEVGLFPVGDYSASVRASRVVQDANAKGRTFRFEPLTKTFQSAVTIARDTTTVLDVTF